MHPAAEEKINSLRLMMSDHVGSVTFRHLIEYYGSAGEAIKHVDELAHRGGRRKPIALCPRSVAEKQLDIADSHQVQVFCLTDSAYPRLLRQTPDAAPVLFVRGFSSVFSKPSVALVGTRNASLNGKALARKIAFDLASAGYNVVSGLAHGIDRAAHVGALACTGQGAATTAVLGTPVDTVYPPENQDIYDQIAAGGCLVSEFPFGSKMAPHNFPRRNRTIAGLSRATVVIEAQLRSGSLITAHLAADYGRDVLAVPGSPVDPRSEGPNGLIREGASLVSSAADIIAVLEAADKFNLKQTVSDKAFTPAPFDEAVLTDARQMVLAGLGPDVVLVDRLIQETGLDARIVNIILVELALAGRLERHPGGGVSLIYNVE